MKINLLILLLICNYCNGQLNLITVNYNFELYSNCPTNENQLNFANDWFNHGGTPDYFNSCYPSSASCRFHSDCVGTRENYFGFQQPFSGNGYAGLVLCAYQNPNGREYIMTQLDGPLTVGNKYYLSAYISRGNGITSFGASNNFGFHFITQSHIYPSQLDNFSHYHESSIITDSINWTKISGSFIADSAYMFLVLGNFYDDHHTDTVNMNPVNAISNEAYYFIDNVCVSEDSLLCNVINKINDIGSMTEVTVYPNPTSHFLLIENLTEGESITILTMIGESILEYKVGNNNSIDLDINEFRSGVYIIKSELHGSYKFIKI